MKIHHEGYSIIFSAAVLVLVFNLALGYVAKFQTGWMVLLLAISLTFFALVVWFFRVPNRTFDKNDSLLYAPADGKVVQVQEVYEPEYFKDNRIQVSIFMSPLNVHVNYYPVSGTISYYKYHPGDYLVAWHPKSSTLNERTTIVIKDEQGKEYLVRQIAGAVARRIVCYSQEGKKVEQGEELGFIKFGSRVDVFLPLGTDVQAVLEQISTARRTIIAKL